MNRTIEGFSENRLEKNGLKLSRPLLAALTTSVLYTLFMTTPALAQTGDRFPHSSESIRPDGTGVQSSRPADEVTRIRSVETNLTQSAETIYNNIDPKSVPPILRTLVLAADAIKGDISAGRTSTSAE